MGALFPRLLERTTWQALSTSGGERQILAIGRALLTKPLLLIFDEATERLARIIRQEIWAAICRPKRPRRMAILVINRTLSELATVCCRTVILERGRTVWQGGLGTVTPNMAQGCLGGRCLFRLA